MDCPNHDYLGVSCRRDGIRRRPALVLHHAIAARRSRGRLFPWRDSLPHLLVPERIPRADRGIVYCRDSRFQFFGFADLRRIVGRRWLPRASRLAVDVPTGRGPRSAAGNFLLVRVERQAIAGALAPWRREIVAALEA